MEHQNEDRLWKVVSIEDDESMIDLFKIILRTKGFEVFGATSGQEGLELIANTQPDVVLLDIMMPGMDGWEVYQQMKGDEQMTDIPVIVVTAKAQAIDKLLAEKIAKVNAYITKPFSPRELEHQIHSVLGAAAEVAT